MNKTIIAVLSILAFASCSEEEMKQYIKEQNYPKKDVYYKGHHYLIWDNSNYLNGVVHDPDCPCHKDTLDIWVEKNDTIYRIIKK